MKITGLKELGDSIKDMLIQKDYFKNNKKYNANLIDGNISSGYGYPIKAFEKFLGYYDSPNRVAYNPSISMSTNFSYCLSACKYNKNGKMDTVIVDGISDENYDKKAKYALDYFRNDFGIKGTFDFYIKRYRKYDRGKGMSESAAVAASVSRSLITNVFGNDADDILISKYARLVSGSGTRAVHNGISMWLSYPDMDLNYCTAVKISGMPEKLYYGIFPKFTNQKTDQAHRLAVKSEFYEPWIRNKYNFIEKYIERDFDLDLLLKRGIEDTLNLHSVLFSQGMILQTEESINLIKNIINFSSNNEGFYFSADTGPSIMILSPEKNLIEQFRENKRDEFIYGSNDFKEHEKNMGSFLKEAIDYFKN